MPCTYVRVEYQTRINLANADREILAEAFKLMPEVKDTLFVDLVGMHTRSLYEGMRVELKNGERILVRQVGNELNLQGDGAKEIEAKVEQYYSAVVQALKLRRDGYNVTVQQEEERVRIHARN